MKRILSLAIAAGLMSAALPAMTAQAADLGVRAAPGPMHASSRCERKFARCMKWFPSRADRCQAKAARCEMRQAKRYERRMAWQSRRGM